MKKRLVVLMAIAIAIGGISVAYAQGKGYINFNKMNDNVSY